MKESVEPELLGAEELAERIARLVRTGERPLIALDHDGTISPIAPRPDFAALAPGVDAAVAELCEVADIVIISGRGLDDLVRRVGHLGADLVTEHGLRRRTADGTVEMLAPQLKRSALDGLRQRLETLFAAAGDADGWLIEDKGVALAVHHRLVEERASEPLRTRVHELLAEVAQLPAEDGSIPGGHVQLGSAVLELRPAGADKGAALTHLLRHRAPGLVAMVGDDATDEPALSVAEACGGIGVLVSRTSRPSAASVRLTDPSAVVTMLTELGVALSRG